MAETTPMPSSISAIDQLEQSLRDPEPMCLVLVEIHWSENPPVIGQFNDGGEAEDDAVNNTGSNLGNSHVDNNGESAALAAVMAEAYRRLRDTLRDYDELTKVGPDRFVLVMRTLADASVMSKRMDNLYRIMNESYMVHGKERQLEVFLGGAVRTPQETSAELLDRIDQAVVLSRSAATAGPVLLS